MKKRELTAQILGMYIGQPCHIEDPLPDFSNDHNGIITPANITGHISGDCVVVPHLRRLENITEEEAEQVYSAAGWDPGEWSKDDFLSSEPIISDYQSQDPILGFPAAWLYLLSRGFDLFGLIDAGLAKEVEQ